MDKIEKNLVVILKHTIFIIISFLPLFFIFSLLLFTFEAKKKEACLDKCIELKKLTRIECEYICND